MRTILCEISNQEIVIEYMFILFAIASQGHTENRSIQSKKCEINEIEQVFERMKLKVIN
jgi:hypothetical protein